MRSDRFGVIDQSEDTVDPRTKSAWKLCLQFNCVGQNIPEKELVLRLHKISKIEIPTAISKTIVQMNWDNQERMRGVR